MARRTGAAACSLQQQPNLPRLRQSRGITLDQIADATKISKRFLLAIEAGEFDKLPGGIFNTSYIRQYAKAIDYDEQDLLTLYYAATGTGPASAMDPDSPPRKPAAKGFRLPLPLARL